MVIAKINSSFLSMILVAALYSQSGLVIDYIDVAENKLVWCGVATGALSGSRSVEERTENINNAVTKILEQFLPTKVE
jgi:hypothetical protein